MFPCPYAQPYTLYERLNGATFNQAPLTWTERLSGWPSICTSQTSIMFGLYFLIPIFVLLLVWFFKFRKVRGHLPT